MIEPVLQKTFDSPWLASHRLHAHNRRIRSTHKEHP